MKNEKESFHHIGISSEPDMPRIRHLMKIGLFAGILVLGGDMLLGYGASDTAVSNIPATFARYLSVSDGRIFWSAVLGLIGIPLECLLAAAALKIPNLPLTNALATGWISIGNIWMFGGLLFLTKDWPQKKDLENQKK